MTMRSVAGAILAGAVFVALSSCSNALVDELSRLASQANQPGASPAQGTTITAHEKITLTFPQAMDPSSVTVSGTMGSGAAYWPSAGGNKVLNLNDPADPKNTTGHPLVAWTAGSNLTLTITVNSGGQKSSYSYTYTVFNGLCVSDPTTPVTVADNGTAAHPFRKIQSAIDAAASWYAGRGPVQVRVGGGTYAAVCNYSTPVYIADMKEGVSLYGGYASDFATRNTVGNASTIQDTDTTDLATFPAATHSVDFAGAITGATVLDGFSIQIGSGSGSHAGIVCSGGASPTLSNLVIKGSTNTTDTGLATTGIIVNASSPVIDTCNIDPGNAYFTNIGMGQANGVYVTGSSTPQIKNSTISGGRAFVTCGIYIFKSGSASTATITSNTIDGGYWDYPDEISGAAGNVIYLSGYAQPTITGNHLKQIYPGAPTMWGIYQAATTAQPTSVRNNSFDYNISGTPYYHQGTTTVTPTNFTSQPITTGEGTHPLTDWGNTHL